MPLLALLITLRAGLVRLTRAGDTLTVEAPTGYLTDGLAAALRDHKAALLLLPEPYINGAAELVIPSTAPPQYHWQPLHDTLAELQAPAAVVAQYVRARK